MDDRDFQADFEALTRELIAARTQAIKEWNARTPETIAMAEAARQRWLIIKERIVDLLEDWDDIGEPTT